MAGLIGAGRATYAQGAEALSDVATSQSQQAARRAQIEAAERAQYAQMGGTSLGLAGSYYLKQKAAQKAGSALGGKVSGAAVQSALSAPAQQITATGLNSTALQGALSAPAQKLSASGLNLTAMGLAPSGAAAGGAAGAGAAAGSAAGGAATAAGTAAATGAAATTGAGAAAAGTSSLAALGAGAAAAAPWVLVGLAGAYLVSKIFD